jgi:hypothetical protein
VGAAASFWQAVMSMAVANSPKSVFFMVVFFKM